MKNLFDITDRVVVITGGLGVLGINISQYLVSQGAIVVVLARSVEKGEKFVGEMENAGGKAAFFASDVLDRDSLVSARDKIVAKYGKIDVLINAAGGNMAEANIAPTQNVFDLSMDALHKVVDLNLFGTILPTQIFMESMVENGKGVILNFSSMSAFRPLTRVCGYGMAKTAINSFTEFMAGELALKFGENFRINAVAPGFFLTEQNRTLLTNPDGSHTERAKDIIKHTPFRRFGVANELNGTVHYLISDASGFVTGTVAVVDGGFNSFTV
ncbi:MAG: SDR family oxidoreductase [Paludibacteraceae bacterium]